MPYSNDEGPYIEFFLKPQVSLTIRGCEPAASGGRCCCAKGFGNKEVQVKFRVLGIVSHNFP